MLSYRHAFHAGNHADVLKHIIVVQLLRHFNQKDKAYWYIDTHAGAGVYGLQHGYAAQNREFSSGIEKLWVATSPGMPSAVSDYLNEVRALNADGQLRYYPGSPYLAWRLLREQDRLRLFELHTTEIEVLRHNFRDAGRRAIIYDGDGFTGIKALLPPLPRRGLTLIDPAYENKQDYTLTLRCVEASLQRFATGCYAIWYPQISRLEAQRFPTQLKSLPVSHWLNLTLTVSQPANGVGLFGSGMFIVNPPYTLAAAMRETLAYLADKLGQDTAACYKIEQSPKCR